MCKYLNFQVSLFIHEFGDEGRIFCNSDSPKMDWNARILWRGETRSEITFYLTNKHILCQLQKAFLSSENFIKAVVHVQQFCLLLHHKKPLTISPLLPMPSNNSRQQHCNWDFSVRIERKESNYPASFLLLTVISDSRNLGKNLQIGGFIENQSCNGEKKVQGSLLLYCTCHL